MSIEKYPLEQLVTIKKNRFDQAVKILAEKKALLAKATQKLYELTQDRDATLTHKIAKLDQFRQALDAGTPTDKIQQMKVYLKVVDETLAEKEKKVQAQQKQVDAAQQQVDVATDDMLQKRKDVEKIEMHQKEWETQANRETERKEAIEHDEQGSQIHHTRKRDEEYRNKEEL
ncbi:MAG: hypothetical protein RL235_344 [Chlamydiota bacterium]|jgi:flagellar biosynthesis chaperone FliJ